MALQSAESCSNGDFQLGFGASINFKPAFELEVHSPPDSRKRMAQHDKGPAESIEETFVQPEPPKKHKATFSTNVTGHTGRDQNSLTNLSDRMGAQSHQSGSFLSQGMNKSANSDDKGRLETVLRDLGQDMKMVYLKWSQPFAESEAFEAFCPARLDELLKEALRLEQHLKNQKERLRERLMLITRTLQSSLP